MSVQAITWALDYSAGSVTEKVILLVLANYANEFGVSWPSQKTLAIATTRPVIANWLAAGYDLAADILPTLAERTNQKHADPIRTWAYFTQAITKRHAQMVARAARAAIAGETKTVPTLTAYDILLRTAEWLNSGRFVPPSAVNNTTRDALLRARLVTEAALRARQIY